MNKNCKCGGYIQRKGWRKVAGPKELYEMTINDGFAHYECDSCGKKYKQKLREAKPKKKKETNVITEALLRSLEYLKGIDGTMAFTPPESRPTFQDIKLIKKAIQQSKEI